MAAYYNENDLFAAAWLRNLIAAGHIAPGEVDERSIEDVRPSDLIGFTQCHFFAGIGVWSLALRNAGWPDDRMVWTGSCPCQPFSAAGKRGGTADERHLWPVFFHLVDQCRPPVVLGEQVASKDGLAWLDLVSSDLEGAGYAFGAVDTCAAGFGAPHIRQRLWFVGLAKPNNALWRTDGAGRNDNDRQDTRWSEGAGDTEGRSDTGGMADTAHQQQHRSGNTGPGWRGEYPDDSADRRLADDDDTGLEGRRQPGRGCAAECAAGPGVMAGRLEHFAGDRRIERRAEPGQRGASGGCGTSGLGDTADQPCEWETGSLFGTQEAVDGEGVAVDGNMLVGPEHAGAGVGQRPGPLNGFWRDADWLLCRDGRWRPVEPGTFPLVNGAANRVGLLRGAGNAIVSEQAQGFIEAVMDALGRP